MNKYIKDKEIAEMLGYSSEKSFKDTKGICQRIDKLLNELIIRINKEHQSNISLFIKDLNPSLKEHLKK